MTLPANGHARIDNSFLLALLPSLPLAEGIQLYLQARGNLRRKGAGLGELITATGDRDPRHTERSAQRLTSTGLIVKVGGLYYAPAFAPAQTPADNTAPTPAEIPAQTPADTSSSHSENSVHNSENSDENFPEEEKEEKEDRSSLLGIEENPAGERAGEPQQTEEGQGPDGPAADAASEPVLPSQDFEKDAGEAPQRRAQGTRECSAAAPPAATGDAAALRLFDQIAGYGFCASYRLHLLRWFEAYSADLLRLAWQVAPTVPGIKIPATAFVWLLNREREWPPALRSQYERDLQAQQDAVSELEGRPVVKVGDLLRWPDGETATVQRLDRADAVTDAESIERGYVALSLIGRGVEVLRS